MVSTLNEGALRFATFVYEVDSRLTPHDRATLLDFFSSVRTSSLVANASVAAVAGISVAAVCSAALSPSLAQKPIYKLAPAVLTGLVVSRLASHRLEVFFFDRKLKALEGNKNCYTAASIYRGVPVQPQIDYYRTTINEPEKAITDPRLLQDGRFDGFVNGLRDGTGGKKNN